MRILLKMVCKERIFTAEKGERRGYAGLELMYYPFEAIF